VHINVKQNKENEFDHRNQFSGYFKIQYSSSDSFVEYFSLVEKAAVIQQKIRKQKLKRDVPMVMKA
jgi:hypothetical protein